MLKKAMGSCFCFCPAAPTVELPAGLGVATGLGAKRSRGRPDVVIPTLDVEGMLSAGRVTPPEEEEAGSLSKTSNDIKSATFWLGLFLQQKSALLGHEIPIRTAQRQPAPSSSRRPCMPRTFLTQY